MSFVGCVTESLASSSLRRLSSIVDSISTEDTKTNEGWWRNVWNAWRSSAHISTFLLLFKFTVHIFIPKRLFYTYFGIFGSILCTAARDSRLLQRFLIICHHLLVQALEYMIVILNILYFMNKEKKTWFWEFLIYVIMVLIVYI